MKEVTLFVMRRNRDATGKNSCVILCDCYETFCAERGRFVWSYAIFLMASSRAWRSWLM